MLDYLLEYSLQIKEKYNKNKMLNELHVGSQAGLPWRLGRQKK
jgi:hypothetical protein